MAAPRTIPDELKEEFTLQGQIPVYDWYFNDTAPQDEIYWSYPFVQYYIDLLSLEALQTRDFKNENYSGCIKLHAQAFEKYKEAIQDKKVAVIGSLTPWIEAIAINFGAKEVTTVEYNVPICVHPLLNTMSYDELCNSSEKFDTIISYSSIEHSGLGRYGDPLNPKGDIETMEQIYRCLTDGGYCFLGVPVGKDALVWNAHRIYGEKRLPLLFLGKFKELEWIGCEKNYIYTYVEPSGNHDCGVQPIIVLQKPVGFTS